jgi:sortase A
VPFGARVLRSVLITISLALLFFAVYLMFFSALKEDRAQHLAYADFRKELALGTAPTGPTDPNNLANSLAPGSTMAVIDIPTLHVNAVVFEGTSGSVLSNGPGHLRDSVFPGQAGTSVIYGRATAFGGPFGKIDQLQPGQLIRVTTGQGVQQFSVLDVRRAGDVAPMPLAAGKGRLTLVTADGPPLVPSGVVRVDAELTSKTQPTPTMTTTAADLGSSEAALATDQSAWVPLVLWGQGLVLVVVLLSLLRLRWTRWQVWVVAVPVIGFFAFGVAATAARLLPNLT